MNAIRGRDDRTIAFGSAGPGRDSTLGLLAAHGHDLLFECRSCGHWRSMPMEEVTARLRMGDRTEYGAVRGRCTRCGSRSVILRTELRPVVSEPTWDDVPALDDALAF